MTKQKLVKGALFGVLLISLLPFLVLTIYSSPASDDYCYALLRLERGISGALSYEFWFWSGRYFATLVLCLNPIGFGYFGLYKLVALLIILLTFTSIFALVNALVKSSASLVEKLIAAALITALFCNNAPDITEAFYWMPGAISYQLANILTLFMFAVVIKALDSSGITRASLLALSVMLIVAIVGSSETAMIFLLLLVGTVTVKAFLIKSTNRRVWLMLLLVVLLSSCVLILAPGNAVRASKMPEKYRFFFSVGMSLLQCGRYIFKWISNPAFALSTILFVPIASRLVDTNTSLRKQLFIHPYASATLLFLFVFMGFFPAYWNMGSLWQSRTVNTAYLFFLLGWFMNVAIWVSYYKDRRRDMMLHLPAYAHVICLALMAITLLATNNTKTAFMDLKDNRALRYHQEMRKMQAQFKRCAREGIVPCEIPKISDLSATVSNPYFVTDLTCKERFWRLKTASEP